MRSLSTQMRFSASDAKESDAERPQCAVPKVVPFSSTHDSSIKTARTEEGSCILLCPFEPVESCLVAKISMLIFARPGHRSGSHVTTKQDILCGLQIPAFVVVTHSLAEVTVTAHDAPRMTDVDSLTQGVCWSNLIYFQFFIKILGISRMFSLLVWANDAKNVAFGAAHISDDANLAKKEWTGDNLYVQGEEASFTK